MRPDRYPFDGSDALRAHAACLHRSQARTATTVRAVRRPTVHNPARIDTAAVLGRVLRLSA